MTEGWADSSGSRSRGFRHEAFLYRGRREYIDTLADFVADGLVRGEPAVVAVGAARLEELRAVLGGDQPGIFFVDMDVAGRNPARLIPAYHDFIRRHAAGRPSRGVGEPIGPHRAGAVLTECEIHEWLCNLAFTHTEWWVVCPYDASVLHPAVVEEARRNHPVILEAGERRPSPTYKPLSCCDGPLGDCLPEPAADGRRLVLGRRRCTEVAGFVAHHARRLGLVAGRSSDLARAVAGIVESVRGGEPAGSRGDVSLRLWPEGSTVVVEVCHRQRVADPLIGREPPGVDAGPQGRAMRAAHELCDLVQLRSDGAGTTVRLHLGSGA